MKRFIVLMISALCAIGCMQAKDNSVAYVDMAYILKNLPQYETANEQLTMIAKLAKEQESIELKRKYFGESGELVKKREALLKPIQDEIYAAIQELANEKHIDVIKDRSSDPGLLYMSSKLDYSDQLLQKLGAK